LRVVVIFNQVVPEEVGFVDELLTKKKLQENYCRCISFNAGQAKTAKFLDDIKELGFQMALQRWVINGLDDVKVPAEKKKLVATDAQKEVDSVWNNYMMGLITDNERYNQVIDIWTRVNTMLTRHADEAVGRRSIKDSTPST
jgi:DNA-directed RNA polymerase subunit beta'